MNKTEIKRVCDIASAEFRKLPDDIRNNPLKWIVRRWPQSQWPQPEDNYKFGQALRAYKLETIVEACCFLLGNQFDITGCRVSFLKENDE